MSDHTPGKWTMDTKTNEHNVCITHIFQNGTEVGHIHSTHHPTIPYEVYWDDSRKSQRCMTLNEGLDIVKAALAEDPNATPSP